MSLLLGRKKRGKVTAGNYGRSEKRATVSGEASKFHIPVLPSLALLVVGAKEHRLVVSQVHDEKPVIKHFGVIVI